MNGEKAEHDWKTWTTKLTVDLLQGALVSTVNSCSTFQSGG